jgi:hypothetical protein
MLSKKQLFISLDEFYNDRYGYGESAYQLQELSHPFISNETYGRKSMIYIHTGDTDIRKKLESWLDADGFKVNRNYSKGNPVTEVQVSYFKGWHWAE